MYVKHLRHFFHLVFAKKSSSDCRLHYIGDSSAQNISILDLYLCTFKTFLSPYRSLKCILLMNHQC